MFSLAEKSHSCYWELREVPLIFITPLQLLMHSPAVDTVPITSLALSQVSWFGWWFSKTNINYSTAICTVLFLRSLLHIPLMLCVFWGKEVGKECFVSRKGSSKFLSEVIYDIVINGRQILNNDKTYNSNSDSKKCQFSWSA